jgi:hypothetical protein
MNLTVRGYNKYQRRLLALTVLPRQKPDFLG